MLFFYRRTACSKIFIMSPSPRFCVFRFLNGSDYSGGLFKAFCLKEININPGDYRDHTKYQGKDPDSYTFE